MHLYKRKDPKFWWYKFVYDGAVYQASTGTKNRLDAEGVASKARLVAIEGKYNIRRQKATPPFKDAMARFIEHARQEHPDHPNTAKRYETASKSLNAVFGSKKLHVITPDEIEQYKTARLGKKLKPATVNADLTCMKAMFNYFVELDVLVKSPAARVKFLPANNEKMRVVSFEEEGRYMAACPQPLHDVAVLMLETGMRPDEIFRMRRENVNLEAGFVFNPYGKTKAARRKLSLTKRAADLLRLRLLTIEGDYIFSIADKQPVKSVDKARQAAVKLSEVARFRLYDLRHTFATRAVEAGVDLVTLAALMGHSRIQMVLRYAHPTEEHQVLAIGKLEEFTIQKQVDEATASAFVQ